MIWMLILAAHAALMCLDEFYCHSKRGLSRWERMGHPLDTVAFLGCCGIAVWQNPYGSFEAGSVFLGFSIFSCLLITKDEWIHSQVCSRFESWIHSLLFILHPIILFSVWQLRLEKKVEFLYIQTSLVSLFLAYQLIYWNTGWKTKLAQ